MISRSLFIFLSFGLWVLACGSVGQEDSIGLVQSSTTLGPPVERYLGCWAGMKGGRLHISAEKLEDLGSGEASRYWIRAVAETDVNRGIETGDKYILETEEDFAKSFLARVARISFNDDGTTGITTYDSYDAYVKDDFVGMGLFERRSCEDLLKSTP